MKISSGRPNIGIKGDEFGSMHPFQNKLIKMEASTLMVLLSRMINSATRTDYQQLWHFLNSVACFPEIA
jgi:hypothetical protein